MDDELRPEDEEPDDKTVLRILGRAIEFQYKAPASSSLVHFGRVAHSNVVVAFNEYLQLE